METAQSDLARVFESRERKSFEERLVGLNIPVPPRGLLVPGATITVVPPRRTLGRTTREHISLFGVSPNMLISAPVVGIVSSIQSTAFNMALMPTLETLSADTRDAFFEKIRANHGPTQVDRRGKQVLRPLTPTEEARARRACEDALRAFFTSQVSSFGQDRATEHDAVMRAYHAFASAVGSDALMVLDPTKTSRLDAQSQLVHDALRDLYRSILDGVAKSVTSDAGARSLYAVAPCTAVLLNRLAFDSREMTLYNILEPESAETLTSMTPDAFREAMGGVQRGKISRAAVFSNEVDRIAVSMRLLNDFYTSLQAEASQPSESSGSNSMARAVIARVTRKYASGIKSPREVARIVGRVLGVPNASSLNDLRDAADNAAKKIAAEMSALSDSNSNSRVVQAIRAIVRDSVGASPQESVRRLGVMSAYEECVRRVEEWIKSTDVVTKEAATELLSSSPSMTVRYGVPSLLAQISDRVVDRIAPTYENEAQRSISLYAARRQS
jgi:hypothetical protein